MLGIGAVGGVLYPYTELLFDQDLNQSQRSAHIDTAMNDDAGMAKRRAWIGAGYAAGMLLLVFGFRAYRRR